MKKIDLMKLILWFSLKIKVKLLVNLAEKLQTIQMLIAHQMYLEKAASKVMQVMMSLAKLKKRRKIKSLRKKATC